MQSAGGIPVKEMDKSKGNMDSLHILEKHDGPKQRFYEDTAVEKESKYD